MRGGRAKKMAPTKPPLPPPRAAGRGRGHSGAAAPRRGGASDRARALHTETHATERACVCGCKMPERGSKGRVGVCPCAHFRQRRSTLVPPPPPNKKQPTEAPKIVCVCACVLRVVAPRAQEWVLFNHHAGARRRVVVCVSKEARNGSRELRWLGWWLGTQPSQCVVRREAERGDKQRVCKRPPPRPACALVQRARRWWLRQVAQVAWGKYMIVCFGCVCV